MEYLKTPSYTSKSNQDDSFFSVQNFLTSLEEEILPAACRPVTLTAIAILSYWAASGVLLRKGIDCFSLMKIKARRSAILLIGLAIFAYGIISTIVYYFVKNLDGYSAANLKMPFLLFHLIFGICLLVLPSQVGMCWIERKNFMLSFWEIMVGRSDRPGVPFRLVLLADIFTSYSRVAIDYVDLIQIQAFQNSWWFLAFLGLLNSLPLVFRLRQCLWEWKRNRSPRHLINSLKYTMGIVVGIIGKIKNPLGTVFGSTPKSISQRFEDILLFSIFAFSTLLSLGWDLIMDWNISFNGFRTYAPSSTPLQSATSLDTVAAAAAAAESFTEEQAEARVTEAETQSFNSDEPLIEPVNADVDQEAGQKKQEGKMGRFSVLFYVYVILFNAFGRFLLLLRGLCYFSVIHSNVARMLDKNTSLYALIEAYRRFNWMLLRVENYHSQVVYLEGTSK
jgi:hypothetical protein